MSVYVIRAAHAAQRSKRVCRAAAYSAALRARLGKTADEVTLLGPNARQFHQHAHGSGHLFHACPLQR
jgi:hypothetical protein